MSNPVEQINEKMQAAVAAQEAGDYKAALVQAEGAYMLLMSVPDSEFESEKMTWDREGIGNMVTYLKRRVNEAGNSQSRGSLIQTQDVKYTRG